MAGESTSGPSVRKPGFVWRFFGRLTDVILDGLVQAAVVALVVFVLTVIWAWRGHLHGVWLERAIGALLASLLIALVLDLLGLCREIAKARKKHRDLIPRNKGFLDHKLDAENAMKALPALLGRLTPIMTEVGASMEKRTRELQNAQETMQQLEISKKASASLDKYSARVVRVAVKYSKIGELLATGLGGWSRWVKESGHKKETFGNFPEALIEFGGVLERSNNQLRHYIATTNNLRGVSSTLDAAVERHSLSWGKILNTNIAIHAASLETLKVFDELA